MSVDAGELRRILYNALLTPMNEWDDVIEKIREAGDGSYQHSSDMLASMSVTAGQLSVYLGHRGAFGCGDHGHETALRASEKRCKALRKANGYSYP
jgi:hypothetical protein